MGSAKDGVHSLADLMDRCIKDEETGCLVWAGAIRDHSARIWFKGLGPKSMSWALQYLRDRTEPTTSRMLVPFVCSNTLCANLEHRRWGTRGELFKLIRPSNTPEHRARIAQGHRARVKSCNPQIASEIRGSAEPLRVLAERYGMNITTVSKIRRGKSWSQISGSSVFNMGTA